MELALHDLSALAASRPELERFFAEHGIGEAVAHRIEVVFEELASNILRHGLASCRVTLLAVGEEIELVFEDGGPAFNPLAQPEKPKPENLETATLGGLGVPLVRKLSTAFRYERTEDGLNRTTVLVARHSA